MLNKKIAMLDGSRLACYTLSTKQQRRTSHMPDLPITTTLAASAALVAAALAWSAIALIDHVAKTRRVRREIQRVIDGKR
jgi:hypothetical protein